MTTIRSHMDLDVWKMSMDFVDELYSITDTFPSSEKFGLASQLRRAGVSIPSNIAEGAGRFYEKEFIQFLYISMGSLSEIETQLEIAKRRGYIKSIEPQRTTMIRIRKMINGLIKQLRSKT
ncbi:MAG: four helix bundle protein [Bacteroidetes bacterium]|nr:four helix bundle protein [Bacteroidota bacterium]